MVAFFIRAISCSPMLVILVECVCIQFGSSMFLGVFICCFVFLCCVIPVWVRSLFGIWAFYMDYSSSISPARCFLQSEIIVQQRRAQHVGSGLANMGHSCRHDCTARNQDHAINNAVDPDTWLLSCLLPCANDSAS